MATLAAGRKLCAEGSMVPTEAAALPYQGPSSLSGMLLPEMVHASLVSLKVKGLAWLTKALGLPGAWLGQNLDRIPLLQEILQLLKKDDASSRT